MDLEKISLYLLNAGAIALTVSFVLFVVHTTALAASRRLAVGPVTSRARLATAGAPAGAAPTRFTSMADSAVPADVASSTPGSLGQSFAWLAFVLIAASMAIRAYLTGRGPWGTMYEFSIAFAWGILLGYLFLGRRYPIRSIAFLPLAIALFLVAYAMTLPEQAQRVQPLVPALQNPPLLTIHVAMAMLSYGIFATSFGAAVAYLIQGRENRVAWLPPAKVLDEVAYRAVIVGFPLFAALLILGSWWASIAWGRYWGWDPKETAALVTWLIYAAYLHARTQRSWAGRPSALILILGFGAVLFTFLAGNLVFPGLHSYSGVE